jgi:hypothetical protein
MRHALFSFCFFLGISCGNEENLSIEKREISISEQTNTPPVVESVELTPTLVYTNDTITASVSISDVDEGQDISLNYIWYIIDAETEISTIVQTGIYHTLSGALYFDKGDAVFVEVIAQDGIEEGISLQSSHVSILNTPPTISEILLTPNTPWEGIDDLLCEVSVTDIDEDHVVYSFSWSDPQGIVQQVTTEISESTNILDRSQTSEGLWTCDVIVSDGGAYDATKSVSTNIEAVEPCRSLEFDGIDDQVEIPDSALFSFGFQDFTIEAILYPYANCGDMYDYQCTYLSHSEGLGDLNKWSLNWSKHGYLEHLGHYMQIGGGQDRWLIQYPQSDFTSKWSHISYVRSNDVLYFYVNGEEVFREDYNTMMPNPNASLVIGGAENNRWFWGQIHAIRISSTARYLSDFGPFEQWEADADTIALWNVFESAGTTLYDASENEFHGVINGASWTTSCPAEDLDGDGSPASEDCNDQNANLHGHDSDGDGYSNCDGDCNINDGNIYPFAGDTYGDGIDSDCDSTDVCTGGFLGNEVYFSACYEPRTWQDALDACHNRGYDGLATILSEDENNFIHELFPTHAQDNAGLYWIGLHDSITEGIFVWSSDLVGNYFNWNLSAPSNSDENEDCTHLYSNVHSDYLFWNDHPCNYNQSYVCEIR